MADFTLDFDVDDAEEAYNSLIADLRNRLGVGDRIEGRPILAPQAPEGGVLHFFDLKLTGGGYTVQVRFRTDNLYLVGYRSEESDIWYELGHGEAGADPLIDDPPRTTTFLPFGANYNNLTQAAETRLEDVPLSASTIGGANDPGSNRARAIIILAFAIAEATRLRTISDLVVRSWWNESSPGDLTAHVLNWARMSSAVQRTRNDGHDFDFECPGINSFGAAILALGVMHLANPGSRPEHSRHKRSVTPNTVYVQGQPLLEIFIVHVNNIDNKDPGELYGTVTVTDSAGTENIWLRAQHDYVKVRLEEDILLEGLSRPLYAADQFYINFDLWDYDIVSYDENPSPRDPYRSIHLITTPNPMSFIIHKSPGITVQHQ
ncbi:hypothetical protein D9757_007352 [Collybiopsis confluens]|uniref:rRNA N-glycosylase n=1 Tax=Collybiopsis confluens TaxID=2823264 RepID=A0A8H5HIG1_9AGAR|nr:hypothetical protein D9757_007352 [Collybiopsis confluens]